jgi:hypothetical protein
MSEVKANKISPATSTVVTLGDSSDTFVVATGAKIDINGTELILDADADTSITADTDDQIDIKIAGFDDFQFTANTFTAQSGSTIAAQALTATTIGSSAGVTITGTTPTLTIGDAGAEDTKIVFDGNAQDYYIGLDDTDDDFKIGLGSAVGTTAHMVFDETGAVTKPLQPSFYAWSSGVQNFSTGAATEITWTTERFDTNADFDLAGERFTAPVAGVYLFHVNLNIQARGTTNGGRISVYFYKNGSLYEDVFRNTGISGIDLATYLQEGPQVSATLIDKAAVDDYYEVFLYHTTGSNLTINYTQNYGSFSGVLLG